MKVTCWVCGKSFELDAGTLAERQAAGLTDDTAECVTCTKRWERAWIEHVAQRFQQDREQGSRG